MGPRGAAALAEGMSNGSLRTLDISYNNVVAEPLFEYTDSSPGSKVTLHGRELTVLLNHGAERFTQGGGKAVWVQDWSGILAIAEALKVPTGSLSKLRLDGNGLSSRILGTEHPEGMQALAQALQMNTTLQCLTLQDNDLGLMCAAAFICGHIILNRIVP